MCVCLKLFSYKLTVQRVKMNYVQLGLFKICLCWYHYCPCHSEKYFDIDFFKKIIYSENLSVIHLSDNWGVSKDFGKKIKIVNICETIICLIYMPHLNDSCINFLNQFYQMLNGLLVSQLIRLTIISFSHIVPFVNLSQISWGCQVEH